MMRATEVAERELAIKYPILVNEWMSQIIMSPLIAPTE
jgi:hypothetical protein